MSEIDLQIDQNQNIILTLGNNILGLLENCTDCSFILKKNIEVALRILISSCNSKPLNKQLKLLKESHIRTNSQVHSQIVSKTRTIIVILFEINELKSKNNIILIHDLDD